MNGHHVTTTGTPGAHWGTCECGEGSPQMHFTWQIEDWAMAHHADVRAGRINRRRPAVEKAVPDEDQLPLF